MLLYLLNLNTSYVEVYLKQTHPKVWEYCNLNTSYVEVYPTHLLHF